MGRDRGLGVAVDGSGNIFITGSYSGSIDFDPGPLVDHHDNAGLRDAYLLKLLPYGYW